jgi:predicted RecA/RadA family phage recombinase
MPQATFSHEGGTIDYTPGSAVSAGDVVVQADLIGIAVVDIAANKLGSLAVEGVFDVAKATNVAYTTVGTVLYWDDTNNVVTTTSSGNKVIGKTVKSAATADPFVKLKLTP